MRQRLLILSTAFLIATAIVAALAWMSTKSLYAKNGFNRTFTSTSLASIHSFANRIKATSATVIDSGRILLSGNDKRLIQIFNPETKQIENKAIMLPDSLTGLEHNILTYSQNTLQIILPQKNIIFTINPSGQIENTLKLGDKTVTRATAISRNSFIFRTLSNNNGILDQNFTKADLVADIFKSAQITEQRNDAGISTDGNLIYDPETATVIYTYAYRNGFITSDTTLSKIDSFSTIDNIKSYQIAAAGLKTFTGKQYTKTKPSRTVNANAAISNGKLYVNSKIISNNTEVQQFKENTTIDVYSSKSGKYLNSFLIRKIEEEELISFAVVQNYLLTMDKKQISLYRISND
ncbi:hypothetical protein HB364_20590 [Pseudoflavitalea sp. X16]|uniref:hypothetical protein n=1 Tax=Paraflavitalea devenefica TaxID=2716334 RepID=UPI00141F2320|nr:hypothetical protein [Paraflavitalea devenefica]NII27499.1 hypothetical protein [Paraflavitalea devenefica]